MNSSTVQMDKLSIKKHKPHNQTAFTNIRNQFQKKSQIECEGLDWEQRIIRDQPLLNLHEKDQNGHENV